MAQLRGVEKVIFNGVAGAVNLNVGERRNRLQGLNLDVDRKRRREAVKVKLLPFLALRLQEKLVFGLVGERDNLGLDRGTVTRPYALDLPVVEGGIREAAAQYLVGALVGVDGETAALFKLPPYLRQVGELMEILL